MLNAIIPPPSAQAEFIFVTSSVSLQGATKETHAPTENPNESVGNELLVVAERVNDGLLPEIKRLFDVSPFGVNVEVQHAPQQQGSTPEPCNEAPIFRPILGAGSGCEQNRYGRTVAQVQGRGGGRRRSRTSPA